MIPKAYDISLCVKINDQVKMYLESSDIITNHH